MVLLQAGNISCFRKRFTFETRHSRIVPYHDLIKMQSIHILANRGKKGITTMKNNLKCSTTHLTFELCDWSYTCTSFGLNFVFLSISCFYCHFSICLLVLLTGIMTELRYPVKFQLVTGPGEIPTTSHIQMVPRSTVTYCGWTIYPIF